MYLLQNKAQNYEWGRKGKDSQVYNILKKQNKKLNIEQEIDENQPYAELWMGSHPTHTSKIQYNDNLINLRQFIDQDRQKYLGEILNKHQKSDEYLPYLFKVLSINKVLSIQAHPDKKLAEQLFKQFPQIYKDNNHKPEIAIALNEFWAFCNFAPRETIIKNLNEYYQIVEFIIGQELFDLFKDELQNKSQILKQVLIKLVQQKDNVIQKCLFEIVQQIQLKDNKTQRDQLILTLNQQFPNDIGLIFQFFLNFIVLQKGECVLMKENEPHAYIKGNCIECMANSDNVIRIGFTPKYKDSNTLINCLTYELKQPSIIKPLIIYQDKQTIVRQYSTLEYKELECLDIQMESFQSLYQLTQYEYPQIVLIYKGKAKFTLDGNDLIVEEGQSVYLQPYTSLIQIQQLSEQSLNIYICRNQKL